MYRYVPPTHRQAAKPKLQAPNDKGSIFERANRASIPTKISTAFDVVPVSYVNTNQTGEKKSEKFDKLKQTMRKMGSKVGKK